MASIKNFKMFKRNIEETAQTDAAENAIALKEVEGLSQRQIVFKRFVHHRAAMVAIFTLVGIILIVNTALDFKIGPWKINGWWKYAIEDIPELRMEGCANGNVGCPTLQLFPPSLGEHPFGQDDIGRDYFALVMRGAQRSLMVAFVIGIIGGVLGTVIGAISGYYRGKVDAVLMRIVDFVITVPAIIIGSVIGFRYGNLGAGFLAIYLGLFSWTGLSRLVRAEFLKLREMEFVDAARVAGASNRRIIFKHILPNAVGIIIVSVTLLMSSAILLETALSYIGFGVVAPDVSLGLLISTYQDSFTSRPYLFWWPGLFIISIALSINFIGDGLRDAFDPRQRRRVSRKERAR
jgi:ABC-type dipeptide/oligopeptide/nickel transport system permease subunit